MLLPPAQAPADSAAFLGIDPADLPAVAALALLVIAVLLLVGFIMAVRVEAPKFESHWGGFGGTGGGWRISPAMAYLIGSIAFGAMFTALVKTFPSKPVQTPDATAAKPAAGAAATATDSLRVSSTAPK